MRRYSWWVPAVRKVRRHFLACIDIDGGSQLSGGESYFLSVIWTHFLAYEDVAGGSQQLGGKCFFFTKYGDPSGGSLLSGRGIIILCVIRRHFLVAAVDPAVSLSMHSPRPMEAIP